MLRLCEQFKKREYSLQKTPFFVLISESAAFGMSFAKLFRNSLLAEVNYSVEASRYLLSERDTTALGSIAIR